MAVQSVAIRGFVSAIAIGATKGVDLHHDVPRADVLRRFKRAWVNFRSVYRPMADVWTVYDNSGDAPVLLERGP